MFRSAELFFLVFCLTLGTALHQPTSRPSRMLRDPHPAAPLEVFRCRHSLCAVLIAPAEEVGFYFFLANRSSRHYNSIMPYIDCQICGQISAVDHESNPCPVCGRKKFRQNIGSVQEEFRPHPAQQAFINSDRPLKFNVYRQRRSEIDFMAEVKRLEDEIVKATAIPAAFFLKK